MTDNHCGECEHFNPFPALEIPRQGTCSRFPPTIQVVGSGMQQATMFPVVTAVNHCGEFKQRGSE